MDVFIYSADIYCEDCGRDIRKRLKKERPEDARHESSDVWPQGPYPDGGGEGDCPQHCGSGEDCLDALILSDGRRVGAFLENPLTRDGVKYVAEKIAEDTDPNEVTALWASYYREELSNL